MRMPRWWPFRYRKFPPEPAIKVVATAGYTNQVLFDNGMTLAPGEETSVSFRLPSEIPWVREALERGCAPEARPQGAEWLGGGKFRREVEIWLDGKVIGKAVVEWQQETE